MSKQVPSDPEHETMGISSSVTESRGIYDSHVKQLHFGRFISGREPTWKRRAVNNNVKAEIRCKRRFDFHSGILNLSCGALERSSKPPSMRVGRVVADPAGQPSSLSCRMSSRA